MQDSGSTPNDESTSSLKLSELTDDSLNDSNDIKLKPENLIKTKRSKETEDSNLEFKLYDTILGLNRDQINQTRNQDSRITNMFSNRIDLIDKGIMALALMSLSLSILEYRLEFEYDSEDAKYKDYRVKADSILWTIFLNNSILVMLNFSR